MDRPELILTYVHADGQNKLVQNNLYQTLVATEITHIKFECCVRHEEAEISFKVPITGLTGVKQIFLTITTHFDQTNDKSVAFITIEWSVCQKENV